MRKGAAPALSPTGQPRPRRLLPLALAAERQSCQKAAGASMRKRRDRTPYGWRVMKIVKGGIERVDELEPLWKALQEHHSQVMAQPAGLAPRGLDESWELRRRKYRSLLAEPQAFVMIAEGDGEPVGYAMVHLSEGSVGYTTSATVADVETLSVMPSARGGGVGAAPMDAVEGELAAVGVRELRLGVVAGNDDAIRFYERRGSSPSPSR